MNRNVFREYDIRGVADRDFSDAFVRDLGRALGTFYARKNQRRIGLSRDCRLSSPRIAAALKEGLLETGRHLVDLGEGPTPMLYFGVFHFELDGGVQVTGSHNPPTENGFKMMSGPLTLHGEDIQQLCDFIDRADFDFSTGGRIETIDPLPAYTGFMRGNFELPKQQLKVVIDAGNGAGGPTAVAAMKAIGVEAKALLCEMDGTFPVHHPDPAEPVNLAMLIEEVRSGGYDLGLAFDGDADRLGVVDGKGRVIYGDTLLLLFARDLLASGRRGAIIGDVKCSQVLYDGITAAGGEAIMWKTGHSLIKAKMRERHALLAGEMSGHLFFADRYYGFDDGIYAALRIVELVANSPLRLDELVDALPATCSTPEIRFPCPDDQKFEVVSKALEHFRAEREVNEVDGARIQFEDGWGLVRASNTQPSLVMRFEASTEQALELIQKEVEAVVNRLV